MDSGPYEDAAQAADENSATDSSGARELSMRLPRALSLAAHRNGDLREALQFPLEKALAQAVYEHPGSLARTLAPLMGRALLHAGLHGVAEALRALDRCIMRNLTPRGWGWRLESLRTGRPLREIEFEHQLIHRVEQVYLIHAETGNLLCSVRSSEKEANDDSGILAAIQNFSDASLDPTDDDALRDTLLFGEMTVVVERGPKAILAGIVYGTATDELRRRFQTTLEQLHHDFAGELDAYDGDAAPLADAAGYLEDHLHTRFRDQRPGLLPLTWVIVVTLAVVTICGGVRSLREDVRWNRCVEDLASQPGIVISASGRRWGTPYARGWRDPLSPSPEAVLEQWGFSPATAALGLTQVLSPDPLLVLRRAETRLSPPEGVALSLEGGTLTLRGICPPPWLEEARVLALTLPGIERFDASRVSLSATGRWPEYLDRIGQAEGLVVLEAATTDTGFRLRGLRDPLALDPTALLHEYGIDPGSVDATWRPYYSADPSLLQVRANHLLAPPEGVAVTVANATLTVTGRANGDWIRRARALAGTLPGIERFDGSGLRDTDRERLAPRVARIEQTSIRFLDGLVDLWPGQSEAVVGLVKDIGELRKAAGEVGLDVRITLAPVVRDAGAATAGRLLADRLLEILVEPPLSRDLFAVRVPTSEDDLPDQPAFARFVRLQVELPEMANGR